MTSTLALVRPLPLACAALWLAACATSTIDDRIGVDPNGGSGTGSGASQACLDFCGQLGGACGARCDHGCTQEACGSVDTSKELIGLSCTDDSLTFYFREGGSSGCGIPGGSSSPARPPRGSAADAKRAFLTSVTYNANLQRGGGASSGLAGADKLCHEVAASAELGGTWRAWLSDSSTDAIDRIEDASPWYNTDRSAVLFPNKASLGTKPYDTFGPLLLDERGARFAPGARMYAWTGTEGGGRGSQYTCTDWTSESFTEFGEYVTASYAAGWNNGTIQECGGKAALFCLEQP